MDQEKQTVPADLESRMAQMGEKAQTASRILAEATPEQKNRWLNAMADALPANSDRILEANREDMEQARQNGMSPVMLDRLMLDKKRIENIASAVRHVCTLDDPVGRILSSTVRPNGLRIDKVSVPIGVIGIIYESRPNVTVDAAVLCLKTGNAVLLRGGSEAIRTNLVLAEIISKAGASAGMPEDAVQLIPWTTHAAVDLLVKLDRYVSLIIPRGGERLIRRVVQESTIPVIKHYKGVCHLYVEDSTDFEHALEIAVNAKCQRPGVCNTIETLLIQASAAEKFVPMLVKCMKEHHVQLRGCPEFRRIAADSEVVPATEDDWYKEYLDLILAVRIVPDVHAAVAHINKYSSGHSDSILTEDAAHAEAFLNGVDSAAVYWNASTRFTDGGEFGMGAEIGISTDKLHARGPMGLPEMTSYKYKIYGSGQIRP